MGDIVLFDISGGLSDFYKFSRKMAREKYKNELRITPTLDSDDQSEYAVADIEILSLVINTSIGIMVQLIILWITELVKKNKQKNKTESISVKISLEKDGQKSTLEICSKGITVDKLEQLIRDKL